MDLRNRFNPLMDETTTSNDRSEFQNQANSFDTALIHSNENVLGKEQTCQLGERSDYRAT